MEIPEKYRGRFFYHFTHLDNIRSIVKSGGLLSTNEKKRLGISHHNIANAEIQSRRSDMAVPVGPRGTVHDYVPFYFTSVNPMLLGLVNRKVVDQPYICFLAVPIEKLLEDRVIFTDASANTVIAPRFYDDPAQLDRLNWDLIDSKRWGQRNDGEKHARMAEVLVFQKVPLDWIEKIIVFDSPAYQTVARCYREEGLRYPDMRFKWLQDRPFYFTKHFFPDRKGETLVTGPIQLHAACRELIETVLRSREKNPPAAPRFEDVSHGLAALGKNFCAIPELAGIWNLKTDNPTHRETVSDHTLQVVNGVRASAFWRGLNAVGQNAVLLAAYLHDMGKGPAEKWAGGIQKAYADHPADAIPMLKRILSEDFLRLSEKEIRWICVLVVYHDLMGDIIGRGRGERELLALALDREELCMLAALTEADVTALSETWSMGLREKLSDVIERALGEG